MLKTACSARVDGERGICLSFSSHPGEFDSSRVSTPGNLPSMAKKMLMPGGHLRKNVKWRERTDSFDNYRGEDLL